MKAYTSVIAAVSTPPGKGGVALIRISGAGSIEIADRVFFARSKKKLADAPPRVQLYGDIIWDGEEIDDALATVFRAPHSYTGEDTVEITCHGGVLVTGAVLEAIYRAGATPAERGEFTRRALINGKLSLTDAEAVGNLLEAESREQIKLSSSKARGLLADSIENIRLSLTEILSSIYARIDYPDEDLGDFTDEESIEKLTAIKVKMQKLLSTYKTGKAINEGIRTVICGKPNVGKSSLYNIIVGEDAAIVTEIEGTTRDVLSSKVSLGRVLLNLSDTAGIRGTESVDLVEKLGIERSGKRIEDAELIFAVFDTSRPFGKEDADIISMAERTDAVKIAILNKCDLDEKFDRASLVNFEEIIEISAKQDGLSASEKISTVVDRLFTDEKIAPAKDAIISSARQNAELKTALSLVESAITAFELGMSADAASSDIERALGQIAELDGKAVSDEVVADIFSKFCVGK